MHKEQTLSSQQEDERLIRAFTAGDTAAFDALVIRYKDMVYTMCYYLLGDADEAADHAQETFVKVYRSLNAFRFESSFSTWLYTIALNTCRNRLKSLSYRLRRKTVSLDDTDETGRAVMEIADESCQPNGELEKKELMKHVRQAIAGLSVDHRTVIVLCDVKGLSYEEICRITGLDMGTVKSRISRARNELRARLRGYR
ncbi:MAG TPA: sigma-70 family RNA polymerase sigma factor [Deltaproteobacteria bacterium]|nr:sigma-70 family RNA polymerase sigma factor [Deltaproteobacteria bacterium]HXK47566.1 sigma-70 family RNA polymerase sigma factor [Deltaproteobacteria bacterium]